MDVSQGLPNKHNAAGSSEKLHRGSPRINAKSLWHNNSR